jgi:hypothetical protein
MELIAYPNHAGGGSENDVLNAVGKVRFHKFEKVHEMLCVILLGFVRNPSMKH